MVNFIKNLNRTIVFWLLFLLSIGVVIYGGYCNSRANAIVDVVAEDDLVLPPLVEATSYLVGRIDTGEILTEKNYSLHLFPASLSKLVTAIAIIDSIPLDSNILITSYAVSTEGDEGELKEGEIMEAQDLLEVLLLTSSNDAAMAFSEHFSQIDKNIVDTMRKKLEIMHLYNTALFDATGLDRQGNFTTTDDLFTLSKIIYKQYPLLGMITRQKRAEVYSHSGEIKHVLNNTNELVDQLPYFWGGKTGSTPEAKDCLLSIYEFPSDSEYGKIPVAIIILHSSDRFEDTKKLYYWVQQIINL